ncbi:hypothetical protein RvY_09203 [Ramazzottius varieornatus]|uniref:Uncharacterized protein n=1 Tax=Ramazzottius varieornatus TaxID=947166 RepID=A0A1D1VE31_RAMVA|nr:hypothetical protein RvY_09203 [Ramazzottius varieornatus]
MVAAVRHSLPSNYLTSRENGSRTLGTPQKAGKVPSLEKSGVLGHCADAKHRLKPRFPATSDTALDDSNPPPCVLLFAQRSAETFNGHTELENNLGRKSSPQPGLTIGETLQRTTAKSG